MNLKVEVRWASEHDPYTKVIPVKALRAWLRNEIESITDTENSLQDCGHRGAYSSLLAELEGLS